MKKKGRKRKKFYPKFEPQYVEVIEDDAGFYRKRMVLKVDYMANFIRVTIAGR